MKQSSSKSKIAVDQTSGKWGLADEAGNWIVSPGFDKIERGNFKDSYKVENTRLYGQINPIGGWIIGPFLKMTTKTVGAAETSGIAVCGSVPEADSPYETQTFSLSSDGVLTISGYGAVSGVRDVEVSFYPSSDEESVNIKASSKFKDLDFHTVIIKNGIIGLGKNCFAGCRNLRRIILPPTLEFAYADFAADTNIEFLEEDGFLYLEREANPHFILLKTSMPYDGRPIVIPADVHIVALEAFSYREYRQINKSVKDNSDEEDLPF